ncbi:MAG TPA: sugar phosphate isomerase/epimerase [Chloroflexota bacterium]
MLTCINGATTMPYPLEEDLRSAAEAGFAAVELWQRKLPAYLERHSAAELRRELDGRGLGVAALCPLFVDFGEAAAPAREAIDRAADLAAELACPTLLVCVRRPPDGASLAAARAEAADELAAAADLAAGRRVALAIEPLGRHPLVPGPSQALDLIERAARPNLGLMLDTFHYYKSAVGLDEIEAIPLDRLLIVHVNDCEDRPLEQLRDADRLYPTLGVIPAEAMLRPLVAKGYRGAFSVEVFREEYWQRPIDQIAREAKAGLDRLLAGVGEAG